MTVSEALPRENRPPCAGQAGGVASPGAGTDCSTGAGAEGAVVRVVARDVATAAAFAVALGRALRVERAVGEAWSVVGAAVEVATPGSEAVGEANGALVVAAVASIGVVRGEADAMLDGSVSDG